MYAEFYNLTETPFPVTPDPKYLFLSDSHKEALASIVYGIENRRGFVAIIGEVGTGKTTILRAYLDAIDRNNHTIIYVFNPQVTFSELINLIATELGIPADQGNSAALVNSIQRKLISEYKKKRNVVLIIDEAQNTPKQTLESLRMLSNIETEHDKLLQIVLAGQPELETMLAQHDLRQLNQRIAVKSSIKPLTEQESHRYIAERLKTAGNDANPVFDDAAIKRIVKFSGGIPRSINIACDTALINGFGYNARPVTDRIVKESLASLDTSSGIQWPMWARSAIFLTAALLISFIAVSNTENDANTAHGSVKQRNAQLLPPESGSGHELNSATTGLDPVADSAMNPVSVPKSQKSNQSDSNSNSTIDNLKLTTSLTSYQTQLKPVPQAKQLNTPSAGQSNSDLVQSRSSEEIHKVDSHIAVASLSPANSEPVTESSRRIAWDPARLPDEGLPRTYTIEPGDILSQMSFDIYGFASLEVYAFLRASNPALADINNISVGEVVVFPPLTDELQIFRSRRIKDKLNKLEKIKRQNTNRR